MTDQEPDHVNCDACGAPLRYDGACENEDCPHGYQAEEETTHTEGPWVLGDGSKEHLFLGKGAILKEIEPGHYAVLVEVNKYFDGWKANARLIAASPTQNEALRAIASLLRNDPERARAFAEEHDIEIPAHMMAVGHSDAEFEDALIGISVFAMRIAEYALDKATDDSED